MDIKVEPIPEEFQQVCKLREQVFFNQIAAKMEREGASDKAIEEFLQEKYGWKGDFRKKISLQEFILESSSKPNLYSKEYN